MKALTLTQPWATLVALAYKRVETRNWRSHHKGRIAIHAAKGYPAEARQFADEMRLRGWLPPTIPTACIIAVATLDGCRRTEDVGPQLPEEERHLGDYSPGRWAWFLSNVHLLSTPVYCKGALGLWTVPPEITELLPR